MEFEFDEHKSRSNLAKHGIDFVQAQELWKDENIATIESQLEDEPRKIVIGLIAGKLWSAVITHREKKIRIISVRRSRPKEKELYES